MTAVLSHLKMKTHRCVLFLLSLCLSVMCMHFSSLQTLDCSCSAVLVAMSMLRFCLWLACPDVSVCGSVSHVGGADFVA